MRGATPNAFATPCRPCRRTTRPSHCSLPTLRIQDARLTLLGEMSHRALDSTDDTIADARALIASVRARQQRRDRGDANT